MTVELLEKAGMSPHVDAPAHMVADRASLPRLAPERAAPAGETAEEPHDETPRKTWSLARLGRRLELEDKRITKREIAAAPHYWYLGTVLALARPSLAHGQVMRWRQAHGITPSRAYRGLLLAEAFASPGDLEGLTLNEALRLAEQRRGQSPTDEKARIRRRLNAVNRILLAIADNVELLRDRHGLSALVERCEQSLACVRRACQRPSAPPLDGVQGGQEDQLPCETDRSGIRENSGAECSGIRENSARCGGSSELPRVPPRAK